ncbi:MAG: hypothetical protein ACRC1P_04950 [Cellulosilyticaceae bacterium]
MSMKEKIARAVGKRHQAHSIKKEQQFFQDMLRGTDYRGTEVLFNPTTLAWLVVLVTVFLQLISLATTYEGSKVYFGGVALPLGLSAPLLFALSIQLIVFCMSHTIRRHFKFWLVMILIMATLCSTYFSYIGIYNHINSPIDYLEERYQQIYGNITKQYQLVIDQADNNMKEYIFDLVGELSTTHTALTKQAEENEVLNQKIQGIKVDTGKINPQTNALKKPNIYNYGDDLDRYYADMAKYNAAVGNMITDTTKQDADLKNQLYENEVKALLGGKTKDDFMSESIQVQTSKEQMEKVINAMYKLITEVQENSTFDEQLMSIQEYCLNFIIQQEGKKEIFSTVLTNLYTVVEGLEVKKDFSDFKTDLGNFMILSQNEAVMMKDLQAIKEQVYKEAYDIEVSNQEVYLAEKDAMLLYTKMQSELKSAAYLLNQMEGLEEPIHLNDEKYMIHNLYVLPINNLLQSNDAQAMSWFCLGFAVLIDGLTLLFSLMQGREKTPLFAKNNKDIVGKSKEAIEELLLATIIENHVKGTDGDVVENALLQLERFLRRFELMPEGMESGYSMWCPMNKLEEYNVFLAILCQFNLANILSREDIILLKKEEEVTEERYVLIRTKFIIWAKQKIADLAIKHEYIEELQRLEENLEVKGEVI